MDFSKFPIEKLWHFIAGVIPGSIALFIYDQASIGRFNWFLTSNFIGYKTKIAIVLALCFVIGNSLTEIISRLSAMVAGAIGGIVGGRSYKPSFAYDFAPWRDPRWRDAVRRQIGSSAPDDIPLTLKEPSDWVKQADALLASIGNKEPTNYAEQRRVSIEADEQWKRWYDHYHMLVLEPKDRDFAAHIRYGFSANMETASVYVLCSMPFVAETRQWWAAILAVGWLALGALQVVADLNQYTNKFATLEKQIHYLNSKS